MLIDGVTGNVLKESAPHIYNHNPSPAIPDDWWAAERDSQARNDGDEQTPLPEFFNRQRK